VAPASGARRPPVDQQLLVLGTHRIEQEAPGVVCPRPDRGRALRLDQQRDVRQRLAVQPQHLPRQARHARRRL